MDCHEITHLILKSVRHRIILLYMPLKLQKNTMEVEKYSIEMLESP